MSKSGSALRAFVRFALPAVPEGCALDTVTLRLYAASAKENRTIEAFQLAGAWPEGGVTRSNQPGVTGAPAT
jgi:hypothetical protein